MEIIQIKSKLEELPATMAEQLATAEKKREAYSFKEFNRKKEQAKKYLQYKFEDTKRTKAEVDALVLTNPEVDTAFAEEIAAEGAYRRALLALEAIRAEWDGVRKLANRVQAEMSTGG